MAIKQITENSNALMIEECNNTSQYEDANNTPQFEEASEPSDEDKNIAGGAAVEGGILVTIIAGPIFGVAAALGCGAIALDKSFEGSEAARSTGKAVIKIDKNYRVVEKSKKISKFVVIEAQYFDKKHYVMDKAKKMFNNACNYFDNLGSKN